MGLDMYLTRSSKNGGLGEEVAYWRKANWLHGWFVNQLAGGKDECQPIPVSKQDLEELLTSINKVLDETDQKKREELAMLLLPPTSGFFFGSYDLDKYYWNTLASIKDTVEEILEETNFFTQDITYQASW